MTSSPETKKAARVRANLALRERLREIRVAAGRHPQGYGNRADQEFPSVSMEGKSDG